MVSVGEAYTVQCKRLYIAYGLGVGVHTDINVKRVAVCSAVVKLSYKGRCRLPVLTGRQNGCDCRHPSFDGRLYNKPVNNKTGI